MWIHVTLKSEVLSDPRAKSAALEHVQKFAGLASFNERRFERYGIISGKAERVDLKRLRQLFEVEAVEVDEQKFAS